MEDERLGHWAYLHLAMAIIEELSYSEADGVVGTTNHGKELQSPD
jgi:hypothetical protein